MGFFTETIIRQEGHVYLVLEMIAGSEDASTAPIGAIRRVPLFGGWVFIGKEGCELTRGDLAIVDGELAELEEADRGRPASELRAQSRSQTM